MSTLVQADRNAIVNSTFFIFISISLVGLEVAAGLAQDALVLLRDPRLELCGTLVVAQNLGELVEATTKVDPLAGLETELTLRDGVLVRRLDGVFGAQLDLDLGAVVLEFVGDP